MHDMKDMDLEKSSKKKVLMDLIKDMDMLMGERLKGNKDPKLMAVEIEAKKLPLKEMPEELPSEVSPEEMPMPEMDMEPSMPKNDEDEMLDALIQKLIEKKKSL